MKYRLVIFDLDGTILNTLDDLAGAVNFALRLHGFPTRSVNEIRTFIGNGVANLIRRAAPAEVSDDECAQMLADFKAEYAVHINVLTKPYPGIPEMLHTLRAAGMKIGINSNKYDAALQSLCKSHFPGLYDAAAGEIEAALKKPDPTAALRMMRQLGVSPEETIYIGDSGVDLNTAKNAGCDAAWVSWGFRHPEDMTGFDIPNRFDDVPSLTEFLLR